MRRIALFALFFVLISFSCRSQVIISKSDSLISLYSKLEPGDQKVNLGQLIAEELLFTDRITAKKYSAQTFPFARISTDPYLKANGFYLNHLFRKKELESSNFNEFAYLDSAFTILEVHYNEIGLDNAKLLEFLIYNSKGDNYYNIGEMPKAIEFYQKAFTIAKEINEPKRIAQVNYNMAICHYVIDNYSVAISQLKSVYELANRHQISKIESASLNILGASYQQIDSFVLARYYIQKAVDLAQESGDEQQIRESLLSMGLIHEELSKLDSSLIYMQKSLDHTLGKDDPLIEAQIYLNMARVESKRGDGEQARKYFAKAEKLNKLINRTELDYSLLSELAFLEYDRGNFKSAYEMQGLAHAKKDSFTSIENRHLIKKLELKYGKSEDAKLIANHELSILQKQRKITYLSIGGALSTLGLVALYLFYLNAKRRTELVQKELALKTMEVESMQKGRSILALSSTLEGQETERSRIAQDLHDGLGGLLSAVKAHYGKIQNEIFNLESLQIFENAEDLLDTACEEVRRISHNLMPPLLRSQGLVPTFKTLLNSYRSANLHIKFDERNMETRLQEKQEVFIFRIAQELLSNAVRHSEASKIEVSLYGLDEMIQLIIEDNGKGFDTAKMFSGLGLFSIKSRVDYLEGELDIESSSNLGTTISISIPRNSNND